MWNIFKDENDINEKAIVGFVSFILMVLFAIADLVTGFAGMELVINDVIYNYCNTWELWNKFYRKNQK